ncbi:hypothetical protein [Kribbella catacumbae]|uniref:hypothetical protein n=1 Tax=Kribbella catacumbae TaxID=460086 RepID=UPI000364D8D7|nr:hypothetical protein [Kribbella catacumbae]
MNADGSGGSGGPVSSIDDGEMSARSFVVKAWFEVPTGESPQSRLAGWYGYVHDTRTGGQVLWRRPAHITEFIERQLSSAPAVVGAEGRTSGRRLLMAGPTLTEVVADMLAVLGARLPAALPALPEPNVTLERVTEKLAGLGNQTGTESAALGVRTLRAGRLDARVRFQLWAGSAPSVDSAVLTLHSDLLDDREELRSAGFLRFNVADTPPAEEFDSFSAWRKTTSFDLLYEYRYDDGDDADSLIARIEMTTDQEQAPSPAREQETITDDLVRWDDEETPDFVLTGPATIRRISALVFQPGPPLGGAVTVRRTDAAGTPPVVQPDLANFLVATGPAEVTLSPGVLFASIGPAGTSLTLGDWNVDTVPDEYARFDRVLDPPIELLARTDRLSITYSGPGLDQTAVVYLRLTEKRET